MDKDSPHPREVEADGTSEAEVSEDLTLQNPESQHKIKYSTVWREQHQRQCIVTAPFPLSMPPMLEKSPLVARKTLYS